MRKLPTHLIPSRAQLVPAAAASRARLARAARRNPWVLTTWAVTLIFLSIALAVSVHIHIPIRDPEGTLLGKRIVLPFMFMGMFMLLDATRRARPSWRRGELPPRTAIRQELVSRWCWQRVMLALIGFFAFHVTYLSYRNLKSYVSLVSYQTHDKELLALDRWMAFGHPPAELLHDALGTHYAAYALSAVYLAFIPMVPVSVAAALTFVTRMRDAYLFLAASIYCWILGTASYYLIPSIGPFNGGGDWQFEDLSYTGVTRVQEALINHRLDLMADPVGYNNVGSIGGFASLHIGIVFMAYLMTRRYGNRVLSTLALVFLLPTALATVYFGWHYLVDDVAGLFIGLFAVVGARWTIYPELSPLARVVARLRRSDASVTAEA